jgi:hypothetical protein
MMVALPAADAQLVLVSLQEMLTLGSFSKSSNLPVDVHCDQPGALSIRRFQHKLLTRFLVGDEREYESGGIG